MKQTIAILSFFTITASLSSAATIMYDPFDDGGRTNGSDPDDVQWWRAGNGATVAVKSDANAVVSGNNSLTFDTGNNFTGVYGMIPSTTLGAIGSGNEGLRLTFDFRLRSVPNQAQNFRFGLINQLGSPFTNDGNPGSAPGNDDAGFLATVSTGTTAEIFRIRGDTSSAVHGGTTSGPFGVNTFIANTSPDTYSLTGTVGRSAEFIVIRDGVGSTVALSATIYSDVGLGGSPLMTVSTTGYTPPSGLFTFDAIGVGIGSSAMNFSIDNVRLESIPEPSALWLTLFSAPLFFRRRR